MNKTPDVVAPPDLSLYQHWDENRQREIVANWHNRSVGSRIVSETEKVRIWQLVLQPGERAPFHRHDESYFWTVLSDARSRSHYHDGTIKEMDYTNGDTQHFELTGDKFFVHDLENIGETTLTFITVEFK